MGLARPRGEEGVSNEKTFLATRTAHVKPGSRREPGLSKLENRAHGKEKRNNIGEKQGQAPEGLLHGVAPGYDRLCRSHTQPQSSVGFSVTKTYFSLV